MAEAADEGAVEEDVGLEASGLPHLVEQVEGVLGPPVVAEEGDEGGVGY